DSGFGASGDPTLNTVPGSANAFKIVNNNNSNAGSDGPVNCNWKLNNNCGSNDEVFSFHTGGANAVFADGHVQFIRDTIAPAVMAGLISRGGGEVVPGNAY